eukprot:CAMPEP_0180665706 /NCGR_PEP_ID=MMETSP1037_2-20121125/61423_1 /TAXON_ID=632150 /ORGANISM="Azadinium spinosum, Strain 3D9" /LENGTH=88 /DNA_ID=CAMNT_0022694163 /DNA_START=171 /DNA_END=437 /DNA_ORIENTATION=-
MSDFGGLSLRSEFGESKMLLSSNLLDPILGGDESLSISSVRGGTQTVIPASASPTIGPSTTAARTTARRLPRPINVAGSTACGDRPGE